MAQGNHPGLQLARRLKRKADQIWVFTTRFDVPATNNGSEPAICGYKTTAKVSGCWRTLATLTGYHPTTPPTTCRRDLLP